MVTTVKLLRSVYILLLSMERMHDDWMLPSCAGFLPLDPLPLRTNADQRFQRRELKQQSASLVSPFNLHAHPPLSTVLDGGVAACNVHTLVLFHPLPHKPMAYLL